MTTTLLAPTLLSVEPERRVHLRVLDGYLAEQAQLTAVERFSHDHDAGAIGSEARSYEALVPLTRPGPGEQYAFHVDLDACTGCKACVTACHSLNGLDPGETWRSVGLLHGGTPAEPVQQTVSTACHHCVDPACLAGCPVLAYEKDPVTGIVRHLDDQCIGCQYCVFTCPYEVPRFNAEKGIVRKCDMCSDRLAVGEAPACVQGCPNEAIAIQIVKRALVVENAQSDTFLPAAPSPGITVPTTTYSTERALPRNLLPADFYAVRPNQRHGPLVAMLVMTQLSVGAFAADFVIDRVAGGALSPVRPFHALVALVTGLAALGASVLHLGRPLYAFRAALGVRTSWLSREILAFGAFAALAVAYAVSLWSARAENPILADLIARLTAASRPLGALVAGTGVAAVLCSVMVYHATRRRVWNGATTGPRFLLTSVVLGAAASLVETTATLARGDASAAPLGRGIALFLAGACATKLLLDLSVLRHLHDKQHGDLKRTALLLVGDLGAVTRARFVTGALGGLFLPLALAAVLSPNRGPAASTPVTLAITSLLLTLAGELCERSTFFSAMTSPRMPGTLR